MGTDREGGRRGEKVEREKANLGGELDTLPVSCEPVLSKSKIEHVNHYATNTHTQKNLSASGPVQNLLSP